MERRGFVWSALALMFGARAEYYERRAVTDMVCEEHPWLPWPHGECGGPGMPSRDTNMTQGIGPNFSGANDDNIFVINSSKVSHVPDPDDYFEIVKRKQQRWTARRALARGRREIERRR